MGLKEHLIKELGDENVRSLTDPALKVSVVYSTGSLLLDRALGVGGVAGSRMVELYGNEGSGKTTMALNIVVSAQKQEHDVIYIDTENSLNPEYAEVLGVNLDNMLLVQCECIEDVFNTMKKAAAYTKKGDQGPLIIWDSVAASPTRLELEDEDLTGKGMATQASAIATNCRKTLDKIFRAKCTLICINQEKEKIGVVYGDNTTTPGGRALKFYSTMRIRLRAGAQIKDSKGEPVGQMTNIKVVKNKLAPPLQSCKSPLIFGVGFDKNAELFDLAVDCGVVKKAGGWYAIDDEKFRRADWNIVLSEWYNIGELKELILETCFPTS